MSERIIVKGSVIDRETRCIHYHTSLDRIAIKFRCCLTYYPCYLCHEIAGCGELEVWPKADFDELAILCGSCWTEMPISAYVDGNNSCPHCQKAFNPNCKLHESFYFAN